MTNDTAFLYMGLILPSLFALTLIAEGIHKVLQNKSGWVSLTLGVFFLLVVVSAYIFLFS